MGEEEHTRGGSRGVGDTLVDGDLHLRMGNEERE